MPCFRKSSGDKMIIPNEIRPELSLYYIGAKILVNISEFNSECNAFELFENMKQMNTNYSLNQHLMALRHCNKTTF